MSSVSTKCKSIRNPGHWKPQTRPPWQRLSSLHYIRSHHSNPLLYSIDLSNPDLSLLLSQPSTLFKSFSHPSFTLFISIHLFLQEMAAPRAHYSPRSIPCPIPDDKETTFPPLCPLENPSISVVEVPFEFASILTNIQSALASTPEPISVTWIMTMSAFLRLGLSRYPIEGIQHWCLHVIKIASIC